MARTKMTARKSCSLPKKEEPKLKALPKQTLTATPHGIIGKSPNNIELDVLKSALQKYIRRQETDKAMTIIDEMYRVINLKEEDEKVIRSLTSNFVNRLIVTCVEDIGIGNPFIPIQIHSLVQKFREDNERSTLRKIVFLLSESEKSREISHLRATFSKPPFPKDDHPPIFESMFSLEKKELRKHFSKLNGELQSQLESVLLDWFKLTMKENKLFGYQIIILSIKFQDPFFLSYSLGQYKALIKRMEETDFEFKSRLPIIEEYCIDKHTREGRSKGKDINDFHSEGALVFPESKFTNLEYKAIYERPPSSLKVEKQEEKKEVMTQDKIESLKLVPRGQILTAKWKHYVFIPKDEPFVYKGPFSKKVGDKARIERLKERKECIELTTIAEFFSLPSFLEDDDGNVWLKFRNLSPVSSSLWKTTKKKGSIEEKEIDVVDRESMGLRQLEFKDFDVWFGTTFFFRAFILAYILRIGDVGPWNCLTTWDKDQTDYEGGVSPMIKMVDFEDSNTRKGESEVPFIFFSKFREKSIKPTFTKKFEEKKEDIIEFCHLLEPLLPTFDKLMFKTGIKPSEEWKVIMDKF
jgi:hypothetical protein